MKKKYRLNERGKMILITLLMISVVIISTVIYLDRLGKINNGTMTVQCDCNMDK